MGDRAVGDARRPPLRSEVEGEPPTLSPTTSIAGPVPNLDPILWLQGVLPEAALAAFRLVTHVGSAPVYGAVAGAAALGWDRRRGYVLAAALAAGAAVVDGLKAIFAWPRPPAGLHEVDAPGYGFPSGHAGNNAVFWATLGRLRRDRRVWAAGVLAVGLVSLSRVVLGVHFVRDVVAGVAVGLAVAGLVAAGEALVEARLGGADPAVQGLAAVLGPLPVLVVGLQGWAPVVAGTLSGFGAAYVAEGALFPDRPAGLVPLVAGLAVAGLVLAATIPAPRAPVADGVRAFLAAGSGALAGPWAARWRRARS